MSQPQTLDHPVARANALAGGHLHEGRLNALEHRQPHWYADIPAGLSVEDVLKANFWKHCVRRLTPNDMVRCVCEDGTWIADLWVIAVENGEPNLRVYHYASYDEAPADTVVDHGYEVRWKGPALRFCVMNKATNMPVKENLYPKAAAFAFLNTHLAKLK